jgi:2-polyprenyl-3-methyl-5-hydroxy-6-metoxy-1,4-benzoquinol methylase/GNAT superfamily N-acetyltransferase
MPVEFGWLPGTLARSTLVEECADLYSKHYGKWSESSPTHPGEPIRLSAARIRRWLTEPANPSIWYARNGSELIGYAIAQQAGIQFRGKVSWVTQLVVHRDFRNQAIGKRLLFSIWTFSNHFAWGLLSANPYAIRALEKATRRRCNPEAIRKHERALTAFAHKNIHYIPPRLTPQVDTNGSAINSDFFVDHSSLKDKLQRVTNADTPWLLGGLNEGWEWFAFTFNDQSQISLAPVEIEMMLEASDDVTKDAYARMTLDRDHKWAQFANKEAAEIIQFCNLQTGNSVLDFGCGNGRHAVEIAKAGISCTGIDYVDSLIASAREEAKRSGVANATFEIGDCRSINLSEKYDAVICLYDVIGTYAANELNQAILNNIAQHLKPGGYAILSVMNYAVTERMATQRFSLQDEPDKLLALKPSTTMEQTGNIFDPQFYMIDPNTKVVYRREQFSEGDCLPVELIVRDRRFTEGEIAAMCRAAGLDVQWCRFVRAGQWEVELSEHDAKAKEILVLCRLPVTTNEPKLVQAVE